MKTRIPLSLAVWILAAVVAVPCDFASEALRPLIWAGTPPADQPPGPGMVRGTGVVVDAKGKPVEGAEVAVSSDWDDKANGNEKVSEVITTRADGSFTFDALYGSQSVNVAAREKTLGLNWDVARFWSSDTLSGRPQLVIRLGPQKELSGTVTDPSGRPIEGADVSACLTACVPERRENRPLRSPAPWLTVRSDAQGNFRFPSLPEEAWVRLCVAAPGRYPFFACWRKPGQNDVRLVVPPAARVEGHVVDEGTGKPIAGLALLARAARGNASLWKQTRITAVTGPDGKFVFDGLSQDEFVIRQSSYADWVFKPPTVAASTGGKAPDVVIKATKGVPVKVLVRDPVSKRPVPDVIVEFVQDWRNKSIGTLPCNWGDHEASRTGADGAVTLRLLPGPYNFTAIHKTLQYEDPASAPVVRIVQGQRPVVVLEPRRNLPSSDTVTVRYTDGRPAAGAFVEGAVTDASGRFSGRLSSTVVARLREQNLACIAQVNGSAGDLSVTLRPGLTISGRIVDKKGAGVPVAILTLKVGRNRNSFIFRCGAYTDSDGYFEIPAVPKPEGDIRYYLTVETLDYGLIVDQKILPTITADNRGELEDIVLETADATITGVLLNAKGEAVSGTAISLMMAEHIGNENGRPYATGLIHDLDNAISDAQGKFIFSKVVLGHAYWLQADAGGKQAKAFPKGGDTNVKLALTQDTPHW